MHVHKTGNLDIPQS